MDEQNEPKLENMTVDQLVQGVASQVWQNGRASAFMEYVNEMKRRLQSEARWIPVEEKLPEENGRYDTYNFWNEYFYSDYIDGQWGVQGVTHWRKLSTPPTEG